MKKFTNYIKNKFKKNENSFSNNMCIRDDLITIGKSQLSTYQLDILSECVEKKSGGLSIPMGSGKTIISLILSLELCKEEDKILIIASKTLIESWIYEIKKFFGNNLNYIVLHQNYIKNIENYILQDETKIILTTPEVISKYYIAGGIQNFLYDRQIVDTGFGNFEKLYYREPMRAFLGNPIIKTSPSFILYGLNYGCIIMDEIQNYTNINSNKCKGLISISSKFRWGLSGTMFAEPTTNRLIGYNLLINNKKFPRCMYDAETFIRTKYKGYNETLIIRTNNPMFIEPKINKFLIEHSLTQEEEKFYTILKSILNKLTAEIKKQELEKNNIRASKFRSYLLVMITYMRQCLVSPLSVIASIYLDICDYNGASELSQIIKDELYQNNLTEWLDDINSTISSRIKKTLEIIDKHKKENIIIFNSSRSNLDFFRTCIKSNRNIYVLESSMTFKQRDEELTKFKSDNGNILLLTYKIGCEGLNLQESNTMILMDLEWNDGITNQAFARILRYGQTAKCVNLYILTSNTSMENMILRKHIEKNKISKELSTGNIISSIKKISTNAIVNLINRDLNTNELKKLHANAKINF